MNIDQFKANGQCLGFPDLRLAVSTGFDEIVAAPRTVKAHELSPTMM